MSEIFINVGGHNFTMTPPAGFRAMCVRCAELYTGAQKITCSAAMPHGCDKCGCEVVGGSTFVRVNCPGDWPTPIHVLERLPTDEEDILIFEDDPASASQWTSGWFEAGQFFSDADAWQRATSSDGAPAKHVTHWLPMLPRPE